MALGMTCKFSICAAALFMVALAYQASAAPARPRRTTVLRLLSINAEGYIKVVSSGNTSAMGEPETGEFSGSSAPNNNTQETVSANNNTQETGSANNNTQETVSANNNTQETVSAKGTSTEDETKFNEFTGSLPGYFKFESAEYSGKYLVLDNGELKADTPSNGNEEWEEVFIAPDVYGFKQSGCFIGFDTNGDVVDPCSLSSTDAEVKIQRDT